MLHNVLGKFREIRKVDKDAKRIATGALTIVCVNKRPGEAMKAMPIPAEIAARFRAAPVSDDVAQPALEERS